MLSNSVANALRMKGGERALATADFVVGFSIASTWEIIRVGSNHSTSLRNLIAVLVILD